MKRKIVARNKEHLEKLIKDEMNTYGDECDLNHIDVSKVKDMSNLFKHSTFNGDISKWDVSNVRNMTYMFWNSVFNQDISNWNVSKVKDMSYMFSHSQFNGDISNWDISNTDTMICMFSLSKFNKDLSNWKPYKLEHGVHMFRGSIAPVPYWTDFSNSELRAKAIESYLLYKDLEKDVENKNNGINKKIKL